VRVRRGPIASRPALARELAGVHVRLAEAEEALRAIRSGEVDTLVVAGRHGPRVFTLQGAEHAYRQLIESMNEGALTLTMDKTILFANQCFAKMVRCPLSQVMGRSFRRFISDADRTTLRSLMRRTGKAGSKIQVELHAGDGSQLPVQISLRRTAGNGVSRATIGLVVTDLTEARRTEELLRALTHRVVQVQEDERGRVALELHDGITQLLCAMLFHSQALVTSLSAHDGLARTEAKELRDMAGATAREVERVTRNLRPGILEQLGLVAALRDAGTEFTERSGVAVKMTCARLTGRLSANGELTLYRILQEALRNVEKHAEARLVTVSLTQPGAFVQMVVKDDGAGFDLGQPPAPRNGKGGLGLLGMRERATYVGGYLQVKSDRRGGTEIEVRLPLPPRLAPARRGQKGEWVPAGPRVLPRDGREQVRRVFRAAARAGT
jgi:two-component system NarL family sensor kinase